MRTTSIRHSQVGPAAAAGFLATVLVAALAFGFGCAPAAKTEAPKADVLPSWNAGPAKEAITNFVSRVTYEGGPDFVPVAERIAVFDNDGTLWSEQPLYFQLAFALDRIKAMAPQHPEWKTKQPFKAILAGDMKTALGGGEHSLLEIVASTHSGMTTDEFEGIVRDWAASAQHPRFHRPYTELAFQPMLELLSFLRSNGFKTYIVSGGGVEFIRAWAERVYGIPPEQVIGSSGKLQFEIKDDKPVLEKLPDLDFIDDGPGKPVGIQKHIGRRPIAAFGNSDGDLQMLQWTTAGDGLRLGMIVHHTDAEREWAYDRGSSIGKLDKALDEAATRGWTLIDMKKDWKRIYAFEATKN